MPDIISSPESSIDAIDESDIWPEAVIATSHDTVPYVLAAKYAQEKQMDDAIVLNTQNNLCDTSKANIFLVKGDQIHTPALHQGCINGVMRRVVIEEVKELGFRLYQEEITEEDLLNADEVFLTNAIQMIRWVKTYKHKAYISIQTKKIFDAVSATIFYR